MLILKLFTALVAIAAPSFAQAGASTQCASCHRKQSHAQPSTSMGRALQLPGANGVLKANPKLTTRRGAYTYTIETRGGQSTYTVTDGATTISVPIHWAFGAHSQTWVLEHQGKLYESLVSFYPGAGGLDVTIGDHSIQPKTVLEALGRELPDSESKRCFTCHTTGAVFKGPLIKEQLESLTPGIQCERCHTGAAQHAAAIRRGKTTPMPVKLGSVSAEETSNLCGQCHRTWDQVVRDRIRGEINVRFQPYRLANSACYDGSDRRMSCTGCHDPHIEVVRGSAAYDRNCLSCHSSKTTTLKSCPAGKSQCSSCHMPKVPLPGAHQMFTDHHIRIVRPGDPYPN